MYPEDHYPTLSLFWKAPPNGPKPELVPNPGLLKKLIAKAPPPTGEQLKALRFARGIYQRALILGLIRWSDYGLHRRVRCFKRRYGRSRLHLLQRLEAAGVAYLSSAGLYNEYHLVFGQPRDDMEMVQGKYHHVWRKKKPEPAKK